MRCDAIKLTPRRQIFKKIINIPLADDCHYYSNLDKMQVVVGGYCRWLSFALEQNRFAIEHDNRKLATVESGDTVCLAETRHHDVTNQTEKPNTVIPDRKGNEKQ